MYKDSQFSFDGMATFGKPQRLRKLINLCSGIPFTVATAKRSIARNISACFDDQYRPERVEISEMKSSSSDRTIVSRKMSDLVEQAIRWNVIIGHGTAGIPLVSRTAVHEIKSGLKQEFRLYEIEGVGLCGLISSALAPRDSLDISRIESCSISIKYRGEAERRTVKIMYNRQGLVVCPQ